MEHQASEPFDLIRLISLATLVPQKNLNFWLTSSVGLFVSRMGLFIFPILFYILYKNIGPDLHNESLYLVAMSILVIGGGLSIVAIMLFWMLQSWILKASICGYQELIQNRSVDIKAIFLDRTNLTAFIGWRAFRLLALCGVFLIGAAPGISFWLIGIFLEISSIQFLGQIFACFFGALVFIFCYSFMAFGDWIILTKGPKSSIEIAKLCWSMSKDNRAKMMVYQITTLTLTMVGFSFCTVGAAPALGISLYGWTESLLTIVPPEKEEEPLIKRTALFNSGVEPAPQSQPPSPPAQHNISPQAGSFTKESSTNQNPTAGLAQFHGKSDLRESYPRDFFDTQPEAGPSNPKAPPMPAPPPPPPRKKR